MTARDRINRRGAISAAIGVACLIILAFSFVEWDMNPGHWSGPSRAICAVLAVVGAFAAAVVRAAADIS